LRTAEERTDEPDASNSSLKYSVTVKISDVENAGTDVPLYVELIGDRGVTRRLDLEERQDNRPRHCERATENEFLVLAVDVGQV
jgi:hypothetical protein